MKYLNTCLICASAFLVACTPDDVDWIEVPLAENTFHPGERPYLEGVYEILVLSNSDLEYKLGLNEGDSMAYKWTVEMANPARLHVEFHGHTHREGDEPGTVMFYKIHQDGQEQGSLVAPFDGIHGWYFDNRSNEDITVRLQAAGFYEVLGE